MSRKDKVNGLEENLVETNTFQSWHDYDGTRVCLNMVDRGILLDMDLANFKTFAENVNNTLIALSKNA